MSVLQITIEQDGILQITDQMRLPNKSL